MVSARASAALWGLFAGDALAMPVHWYYDLAQLRADFGVLTTYEAPMPRFPNSIMSLSSTGGGGRGSDKGDIVGRVILHGKQRFWARGGAYHYHNGMQPGENTLEAQLVRVALRTIARAQGSQSFPVESFRKAYVRFMTTPGTHNDTYASTCHRMFFANYDLGRPLEDCPDNDQHNVDTIDGLTVPAAVAAVSAARGRTDDDVVRDAVAAAGATRHSPELQRYTEIYVKLLLQVLRGADLRTAVSATAQTVGFDVARSAAGTSDPMAACYLHSSFPALLHFAFKHSDSVERALLANANAGGENVARGAALGVLLGAYHSQVPASLRLGLTSHGELQDEIEELTGARPHMTGATAGPPKREL